MKDVKILLRKKKKKSLNNHECNINLSEDQKQNLLDYRRDYYIIHKK